MDIANWIWISSSLLLCFLWYFLILRNLHSLVTIPLFEREDPPALDDWPKLSIIISACNEAHTIQPAISTILEQDYPDLEIILVNDRSTDKTGEIIDHISKKDSRVKTINITQLPERWLGKVHALYEASKRITGDWILITDADVHLRQRTLRQAIALCASCGYDHLSLLPKVYTSSFWHEIVLKSFAFLLLQDIRNLKFCGVGAFNLVKRSSLEKTEGFPWLRMEVADDMGLALLLQRAGAKNGYAFAFHHVSLTWYPSFGTMFRGLGKNAACAAQYSLYKSLIFALCLWAIVMGPILVLLHPSLPYLPVLGIGAYGLLVIYAVAAQTRLRENLLPSLFLPAGLILISFIVLLSGIVCKLRGGVSWRGTHYKTEDLIMGQRFK